MEITEDFTRQEIKNYLDERQLNQPNYHQSDKIFNCIWCHVNEKQKVVPFNCPSDASYHIRRLYLWYYKLFTDNYM